MLLKSIFRLIKDKFDFDLFWALSIISFIIYATVATQNEFEKSVQRIIDKNLEINGYNFSNISDVIIKYPNRKEEVAFLSEKDVTILVKTFNKKEKLVLLCTEAQRGEK